MPDAWFDAYRLVRPLGEGGMGVVWLAEQHEPIRRTVALKVVKPGTDSTEVLRRFESERQALAILNHPNIAMVFDAGVAGDGRPYFVMEHVPGEPLTEFADRCTLTIDGRVALFLQVCDAVQHAHQSDRWHWLAASQYLRNRQWDKADAETAAMVEDPDARWEVWGSARQRARGVGTLAGS